MNSWTCYGGKVLEKENHMEDLGVDGKIILELIFKNCNIGRGLDWDGWEFGQVAGSCEYGNKHSGFIKCGEFLSLHEDLLAPHEGLKSMELFS